MTRTTTLILGLLLVLPAPCARAEFLFVSSTATNQILEYDSTTGAPIGTGAFVPAGSAGLSLPIGLTFGPNGNLFVGGAGTNQVLEFNGTSGALLAPAFSLPPAAPA